MKRSVTLLLFLFIGFYPLKLTAQFSTEGKDFWFGFMFHSGFSTPAEPPPVFDTRQLIFHVTATRNDAKVNFQAPLHGLQLEQIIPAGTTQTINVTDDFRTLMPMRYGQFPGGIHITSDALITVHATHQSYWGSDGTVVLPTNSLSDKYIVTSYREFSKNIEPPFGASQILIVATEDDTDIEVVPPANANGSRLIKGVVNPIRLNAGETYLIQSTTDLSTTSIKGVGTDCKKFAVFAGNASTQIECGGAEPLFHQMTPTIYWGKDYFYFPTVMAGDMVKIQAAEDNTTVSISGAIPGGSTFEMQAGEVREFDKIIGARSITSDKPVSVGQIKRGENCEGLADPFFVMLSPMEQMVTWASIRTPESPYMDEHFLTLITKRDSVDGILLDGENQDIYFTFSGDYAFLRLEVSEGAHEIIAPKGITAYLHGYGEYNSYGYMLAASTQSTKLNIQAIDSEIGPIIDGACKGSTIRFFPEFLVPASVHARFTHFEWDFGDGTLASGREVDHRYDEPGTYVITLTISDGNCRNEEIVAKAIRVYETEVGEISGAQSVCLNTKDVEYSVDGPEDNTYEWFVEGGEFNGQGLGTSVSVNWGDGTITPRLRLLARNFLGCPADTVDYDISIDQVLSPAIPQGPELLCFTENEPVQYSAPLTPESIYTWDVTGGEIVSGRGTHQVEVVWETGSGSIQYEERTVTVAGTCIGKSPVLEVYRSSEITVANVRINDVSCKDMDDGSISVEIAGGEGPYSYSWTSGSTSATASRLRQGCHSLTVQDQLGCIVTFDFDVEEPDEFVATLDVRGVRCSGSGSGRVSVFPSGGTPPYSMRLDGGDITTEFEIDDLEIGEHFVAVRDANGCAVGHFFWIEEESKVADIALEKNDILCHGTNNGSASLTITGGDAPFEVSWDGQNFSDQLQETGLSAGTHEVRIKDVFGCIQTQTFEIAEPEEITITSESTPTCAGVDQGTLFTEAHGGMGPYTYTWDTNPVQNTQLIEGLTVGKYTVTITDANGCQKTFSEQEVVESYPFVRMPNAFRPSAAAQPENRVLKPIYYCPVEFEMKIFNKWGQLIFFTDDIDEGWDGSFQGQDASEGLYSYQLAYQANVNGREINEVVRGTVRLFR